MHFRKMLALLVWSILSAVVAKGQSTNASLSGQITDTQNLVIVGAEVQAVNQETGVVYPTKTNSDGFFSIPDLPPGTYELRISKTGFRTMLRPDIILHVEDSRALNATLQVGDSAEIVRVEGGAPLINTQDAAVSTVIDRQFVEGIPLNGQSFNTLLQLTPGVVITPSNVSSPGQFSINGQRTNANSFQVDGASANFGVSAVQYSFGQAGGGGAQGFNAYGGTASLVSVDAVQEFRTQTSGFAPEYGRTPGGQVSITTRSGTNQFHGDVFDYFRNNVLDANDWFANAAGKPRAPERQNDFGGVFGGPIVRDRTFFFLSYEGLRLRQPQTSRVQVPSVSLRQAPTTIPAAAAILNAYPLPDPNGPITPDGNAARFTGTYSNQITMNATSLRIDQVVNDRLTLFGRYNYSPSETIARIAGLSTLQDQSVNTTTLTLGADTRFTTNTASTARFNYSKQEAGNVFTLDSLGGAVPPAPTALLPAQFSPSQASATFFPLFDGVSQVKLGAFADNSLTQWNAIYDLSMLKGPHQLKFGFDYNRLLLGLQGLPFAAQYLVQSAQKFASTDTAIAVNNVVFNPGKILFNEFSLYAQDRWSVGRRLTLTYGLRWELNPTASGQNTVLASWQNVNDPANLALAPPGTSPWKTTYTNFAPRVGLAYRITSKGEFVIRGGTGVFYDLGSGIAPALANAFPNQGTFFAGPPSGPFPIPATNPATVSPSFSFNPPFPNEPLQGISPDLELPYSYQWNVAMEKSLGGSQSLSVTYVGQVGRRLLRSQLEPKPNANFRGTFLLTGNGDSSNYNALQAQYKMRSFHGMQMLLNYTWSHSIDTNSSDATQTVAQVFVPAAGERASSNFDVRHNLSGAFVYAAPSVKENVVLKKVTEGWSFSSFVLARSGFPINIFTQSVPLGGASAATRPDLVPGQPIWIQNSGAPGGKVLNPNAFILPSTPRQGTLPRNFVYGFGATQFDSSVQRKFGITERMNLQFRADVFNIFNHPNFADPVGQFPTPQFGVSGSVLNQGLSSQGAGLNSFYNIGGPRSVQLSLKLFF